MGVPRKATDPGALRALAVHRVEDGDAAADVAADFGVSVRTLRRWLAAWRSRGAQGLLDAARPGRPPKLGGPQAEEVLSWLGRDATEFGFPTSWWTAPRVAELVRRRLGVSMNHRYLNDWLGRRGISPQLPQKRAAERDQAAIDRWVEVEWPAIKRQARRMRATLCFTDETGFLAAPLLRRSLAPVGHAPVLRPQASQRDKVSAVAALTVSPGRGHLGLYFQTYPNEFVNNELYALFLRGVTRQIHGPIVVVHDGGGMHKGPPVMAVVADHRTLRLHRFPAYAPELNPPEYLWQYSKDYRMANFVPDDVPEIDRTVTALLHEIRHDQGRLRTFFLSSPLPWAGVTGLF